MERRLPQDDDGLLVNHVLASDELKQCSLACTAAEARIFCHVSYVATTIVRAPFTPNAAA